MNKKKVLVFLVIGIFILAGLALVLSRKQYNATNPPDQFYFESKYTSLDDAQKCVDEWHKYYPPVDGLEQTLTGIPCPGQAR